MTMLVNDGSARPPRLDDGSSPPVPPSPPSPPSLPGAPERSRDAHPDARRLILPAILAAAVAVFCLVTPVPLSYLADGLLGWSGADPNAGYGTLVVLCSVCAVAGILICRWRPWWGLALAVWPFVTIALMGTFVWAWWPALIAVAAIIAVDDWLRAIPAWAAAVAIGIVYSATGIPALLPVGRVYVTYPEVEQDGVAIHPGVEPIMLAAYVVVPTVAVLVAAAIGMSRRAHRASDIATATMQTALQTESVAGERARIARDLHDVVAHHISLVAVRAESAPYLHPELPEAARDVLGDIAGDARHALDELRQVLVVLDRAEGEQAERRPQPGVSDIDALVSEANAAGQAVSLTWTPAELSDEGDIPAAVAYLLYRVVQEALTNARRHAPGEMVRVAIGGGPDTVTVTVANDVDARYRPGPPGRGLIGMRERVTVFGGTIETGVREGSFVVTAALPRTAAEAGE